MGLDTTAETAETKKTSGQKIIYILKAITGVILGAGIVTVFFIDRVILIVLPHIKGNTLGEVFRQTRNVVPILYRVGGSIGAYIAYNLFKTMFF